MKSPVRVAVSGAAGRIANHLLFSIASGQLLGNQQPVVLSLLETTACLPMLAGIAMELHDGAFPLLAGVEISDNPLRAFENADYAFLISSPPDSLAVAMKTSNARMEQHGNTFTIHGKALNKVASCKVRVLVVSNPVMVNALIVQQNAPDLVPSCISALIRLDHNRAHALLAQKTGVHLSDVRKLMIWGNHSNTQYPDFYHATAGGVRVHTLLDDDWLHQTSVSFIRQRGYAVVDAYGGIRAAASAAKAAIDHMRDWVFGTRDDDWTSMGIFSDGSYGVRPGIYFSFPIVSNKGEINIVEGLELDSQRLKRVHLSADEVFHQCRQLNLL